MDPSLQDIDLSRRELFRQGFPHALFARLRREAPVWRHPDTPGVREAVAEEGFWVVSTLELTRRVARDWETFSSLDGPAIRRFEPARRNTALVAMDPPSHTRLRGLINRGFTPRMVRRLEEQVRGWARRVVDAVLEKGSCEFVSEVAYQIPMHMIADIVGIPESDRGYVFDRVNDFMRAGDPEVPISEQQKAKLELEVFAYAQELGRRKRARPEDDVWSVLTRAEIETDDGGTTRLSELELDMFFMVLALAGSETTRNSISHGLVTLLEHRDQLERFLADPGVRASAAEEIIRWTSPLAYWARTATRDVLLGGQLVRAGDRVSYWFPSANRDESAFDASDRFDIARSPNHHVAFGGGGVHICLGAHLARLQVQVAFEEFLARAGDVELTAEPRWGVSGLHNNVTLSLCDVPLRVHRRRND